MIYVVIFVIFYFYFRVSNSHLFILILFVRLLKIVPSLSLVMINYNVKFIFCIKNRIGDVLSFVHMSKFQYYEFKPCCPFFY